MDGMSPPQLNPAHLPPGTIVGPWRVESWAGSGVYGAVYRAVPVEAVHPAPVALKVALLPNDPRFAREVALLSRAHHPSIPSLYGHGTWQAPGGTLHPFLAMRWVDGLSLYNWARLHPPSSAQVLRLLAQLAGALHALHAQGGIHRDVKGGNVLIHPPDSLAFLMDFGSGIYPGAASLTPPSVYPGTPAYRSPESWLFELQSMREPSARYRAGPADDLYALGVTACRLLTGEYPELAAPLQDEHGTWRLEAVLPPPSLMNTPHVEPRLRALVLRMLSVHPEERGTAAQLAEALEEAAQHTAPASSVPVSVKPLPPGPGSLQLVRTLAVRLHASPPTEIVASAQAQGVPAAEISSLAGDSAGFAMPHAPARPVWPWLALAAGLTLAVWIPWPAPGVPPEQPPVAQSEATEAGTAGLGAAAAATSVEEVPPSPRPEVMAEDALPEPLPGQTRPDAKGRCPHKGQIALNKGCWLEVSLDRESCEGSGGRAFKGTCYVPVILQGRNPTSHPTEKP